MAVSSAVPVTGSGPDDVGWLVRRAARGDQRSWDALVYAVRSDGLVDRSEHGPVAGGGGGRLADGLAVPRRAPRHDPPARARRRVAGDDDDGASACACSSERSASRWWTTRRGSTTSITASVRSTAGMLSKERNEALWDAFAVLPESSQKLLTLLMVDPPMSYQDISTTLDMPIGSIGPTRARILAVLRREVLRRGITSVDSRL